MSPPRVVAIDGAAGSGKSTLARGLARALGVPYVNTGLMYRALAAAAVRAGVSPDDANQAIELTRGLKFTLRDADPPELEVEGFAATDLTTPEVEATVSAISRHPQVRRLMRDAQRALGERGVVMEGRDIGAVVFVDAPVKLYLVAEADTRAARRAAEREAERGVVSAAMRTRDALDARTNPFEPPVGAHVLDTTHLSIEATVQAALAIVRDLAPELLP